MKKTKKKSPFSFKADHYGVNSPELEPLLQSMESQRFVRISSPLFSKRNDLSIIDRDYAFQDESILAMSPSIKSLVQALNPYSADDVIAISYSLFPETTTNSQIKPKVNKKIVEMFSSLSTEFEEHIDDKIQISPISNEVKALYPQFNDLDARIHMMKSLGLEKLPEINPAAIDNSTGFIAKKYPFFQKYNLEEMLEDARRR